MDTYYKVYPLALTFHIVCYTCCSYFSKLRRETNAFGQGWARKLALLPYINYCTYVSGTIPDFPSLRLAVSHPGPTTSMTSKRSPFFKSNSSSSSGTKSCVAVTKAPGFSALPVVLGRFLAARLSHHYYYFSLKMVCTR